MFIEKLGNTTEFYKHKQILENTKHAGIPSCQSGHTA